MIYTWAADITPLLQEQCYRRYYMEAPRFRQEKADAIKPAIGKAQSIGVWSLYAQMKSHFGLKGQEAYNFSHAGAYALCSVCVPGKETEAVPRVLVGCDVEALREDGRKLAKRFFCESEYERIAADKGVKQRETFTRYWVLKESFVKATGRGMAIPLNAFEIQLGDPSELVKQPAEYPERFYYMESELEEGAYRVAVCSTDREMADVRLIHLGLEI